MLREYIKEKGIILLIKKYTEKYIEITPNNTYLFRIWSKTIAEIFEDVNMDIINEKNNFNNKTIKQSQGIKITAGNVTKTVLMYTYLPATNFKKFKCNDKKITIGLNLQQFYKFVKTANHESELTLYMEIHGMKYLNIRVDKNPDFKLNLLDLQNLNIKIDKINCELFVRISAAEFKQICKNAQHVSNFIKIKYANKQLIFIYEHDSVIREKIYKPQHENMVQDNGISNIEGTFEIKYLMQFLICASVCDEIKLYMRDDSFLIIKFEIPELGHIYFCLLPRV
jgi:proliferating cell nuclear antigen PCNA